MTDQAQAIEDVLSGFQSIGPEAVPPDVGAAFETMAAQSAERIAARRAEREQQALPTVTRLSDPAVTVEVIPGVVIRPGDVLLLASTASVTADQAAAVRAQALERLPGLADVVVLSGVTVAGVYREEEPES